MHRILRLHFFTILFLHFSMYSLPTQFFEFETRLRISAELRRRLAHPNSPPKDLLDDVCAERMKRQYTKQISESDGTSGSRSLKVPLPQATGRALSRGRTGTIPQPPAGLAVPESKYASEGGNVQDPFVASTACSESLLKRYVWVFVRTCVCLSVPHPHTPL
jgi:hypothetical protein